MAQSSDARKGHRDAAVYRLAVLGAGNVGKSALINRWILHDFNSKHTPTVEDRHQHNFKCGITGLYYPLLIIDTGGDQQFPAMQQLYMRDAQAFFLVFSVDNRESVDEASKLRDKIIAAKGDQGQAPIVLVANKVDLPSDNWVMSEDDMLDLSSRWGCPLVEASAKKNVHVDEMFGTMLLACKEYFGCPFAKEQEAKQEKKRKAKKCTCVIL